MWLRAAGQGGPCAELLGRVEEFDFDAALVCLRKIASALDLAL